MKANFQFLPPPGDASLNFDWTPDVHLEWLTSRKDGWGKIDSDREPPEGYEDYTCIDAAGTTLEWLNESFPADKFTWYVWFESVFLVPDNMLTFLKLKWT